MKSPTRYEPLPFEATLPAEAFGTSPEEPVFTCSPCNAAGDHMLRLEHKGRVVSELIPWHAIKRRTKTPAETDDFCRAAIRRLQARLAKVLGGQTNS